MLLDFISKRYIYLIFSAIIIVPGLISLAIPPGLRPGIEFTSGSLMTLRFANPPDQGPLRDAVSGLGHPDAIIQRTGEGDYLIRTRTLEQEARDTTGALTIKGEQQHIQDTLCALFGGTEGATTEGSYETVCRPRQTMVVLSFDQVSPIIATEIAQKAALAVLVASVFILVYISFAFRQVANPFRYGACAIIALIHDVLVVLGAFSIMGKLFSTEIDSLFITAVLTVIGFSVHDTIVVFDRTRENTRRLPGRDLAAVVNVSLNQTLARSLTTSLTLIVAIVALLLFGGVTIQNFLLTLLIGVISGTYSSIFIASQLLVMWEKGELNPSRWFNRGAPAQQEAAR